MGVGVWVHVFKGPKVLVGQSVETVLNAKGSATGGNHLTHFHPGVMHILGEKGLQTVDSL